jgi:hypothetical protein
VRRPALRLCAAASVLPIMRAKVTALHRAQRPAGGRRFFALRNVQKKAGRDNGFLFSVRRRYGGIDCAAKVVASPALRGRRESPSGTHTGNALIDGHVDA